MDNDNCQTKIFNVRIWIRITTRTNLQNVVVNNAVTKVEKKKGERD